MTIKCATLGDNAVTIEWLVDGQSFSDKSSGNSYANEVTSSQLQVNFTSRPPDEFSLQKCQNIDGFQLKCATIVTCQATRANANDVRKDYLVEATLGRFIK